MKKTVKSVTRKLLDHVAEQRKGFKFGTPERVEKDSLSAVLPIIRETTLRRQYVLLGEAPEVEVKDTGRIDRFRFVNKSKHNVFARSGTIFRGSTQERALTRSAVLLPGKECELEVRCVHASKGIRGGTVMKSSGLTPHSMDSKTYGAGYKPGNQGSYWRSVSAYSAETQAVTGAAPTVPHVTNTNPYTPYFGGVTGVWRTRGPSGQSVGHDRVRLESAGPAREELTSGGILRLDSLDDSAVPLSAAPLFNTAEAAQNIQASFHGPAHDDLASTVDSVASNLDAILKKVHRVENQVGMALLTEKGLQLVELFDVPNSWTAMHEDCVKRVGSDLAKKDNENVFDFNPVKATNTVAAVLAQDWKENEIYHHKSENGDPDVVITGLTFEDRWVGECVQLDGRVVHLTVLRLAA